MTQVFDSETGVVTPVTVIEAGPCPVVEVKTPDVHGYEAVQLAFDAVAERKLSKGELGHLKKNGVEPHRHLVEFRGPSDAVVGESVTVESFEPGDSVKVSGISIGKGFQGTIKRHTQVGLVVHSVDPERNLLLVKGAVPGPKSGLVEIREDRSHGSA